MRIDIEYIKRLLDVFLESEEPTVTLRDFPMVNLKAEVGEDTHKFVFHMEILEDQRFVVAAITAATDIGIRRSSSGYIWAVIPIRLTATGHQFAASLNKPGVFEQLKTSFVELGPVEMVKATFSLSTKALENKLNDLTKD